MKTIKQIADEIGVSKQAVYQRIKREPLCTSLQPYISTIDSTVSTVDSAKYIDVDGEKLIKQAFARQKPQTKFTELSDNQFAESIRKFAEIILQLQSQLEVKDRYIENMAARLGVLDNEIKNINSQLSSVRENMITADTLNGAMDNLVSKIVGTLNKFWNAVCGVRDGQRQSV